MGKWVRFSLALVLGSLLMTAGLPLMGQDATPEATSSSEIGQPSDQTSCGTVEEENVGDSAMTEVPGGWQLVWADEFDGEAGTPVNEENWKFDLGGSGWGNNELEFYTDLTENVSHDGNGCLAIVARRDETRSRACHYGLCDYTSARILTRGKFEFTYGRVEGRVKVPRGQGIWPAFWMLGSNIAQVGWPQSGEIDVMENIGKEPRTVHGTPHGPGYFGDHNLGKPYSIDEDFADAFHTFAVEWEPGEIRWYVDGTLYNTVTPEDWQGYEWVFDDQPFFIILNVAVGGYWPGYPDNTTEFPQTMLVDYVRVYQTAGS